MSPLQNASVINPVVQPTDPDSHRWAVHGSRHEYFLPLPQRLQASDSQNVGHHLQGVAIHDRGIYLTSTQRISDGYDLRKVPAVLHFRRKSVSVEPIIGTYDHPGGIQAIGNYVAVPVWYSDQAGGEVLFFDETLRRQEFRVPITDPDSEYLKPNCVGIASVGRAKDMYYVLAVGVKVRSEDAANVKVDEIWFYFLTPETEQQEMIGFNRSFLVEGPIKLRQPQGSPTFPDSISLFADSTHRVYLVGMRMLSVFVTARGRTDGRIFPVNFGGNTGPLREHGSLDDAIELAVSLGPGEDVLMRPPLDLQVGSDPLPPYPQAEPDISGPPRSDPPQPYPQAEPDIPWPPRPYVPPEQPGGPDAASHTGPSGLPSIPSYPRPLLHGLSSEMDSGMLTGSLGDSGSDWYAPIIDRKPSPRWGGSARVTAEDQLVVTFCGFRIENAQIAMLDTQLRSEPIGD